MVLNTTPSSWAHPHSQGGMIIQEQDLSQRTRDETSYRHQKERDNVQSYTSAYIRKHRLPDHPQFYPLLIQLKNIQDSYTYGSFERDIEQNDLVSDIPKFAIISEGLRNHYIIFTVLNPTSLAKVHQKLSSVYIGGHLPKLELIETFPLITNFKRYINDRCLRNSLYSDSHINRESNKYSDDDYSEEWRPPHFNKYSHQQKQHTRDHSSNDSYTHNSPFLQEPKRHQYNQYNQYQGAPRSFDNRREDINERRDGQNREYSSYGRQSPYYSHSHKHSDRDSYRGRNERFHKENRGQYESREYNHEKRDYRDQDNWRHFKDGRREDRDEGDRNRYFDKETEEQVKTGEPANNKLSQIDSIVGKTGYRYKSNKKGRADFNKKGFGRSKDQVNKGFSVENEFDDLRVN